MMDPVSDSSRFVLIGGGKMGEALVGGWIASRAGRAAGLDQKDFVVVEPTAERRRYLEESQGLSCVADVAEVCQADVVILAVKPQVILDVLAALYDSAAFESALYISIAAGMTTSCLTDALPRGSRLVRVMPNLPLLVGAGASVVCASKTSLDADVDAVCALFACLGEAEIISEDRMDAACALSGSGPAYVAAMIESLVKAGITQGLPASLAERLVLQTVYGTVLQLKTTDQSPTMLREAVSSPGGTTRAALAVMEAADIDTIYNQGVAAAVRRAKELGVCKA